jgi:hypothetical protein
MGYVPVDHSAGGTALEVAQLSVRYGSLSGIFWERSPAADLYLLRSTGVRFGAPSCRSRSPRDSFRMIAKEIGYECVPRYTMATVSRIQLPSVTQGAERTERRIH